MKFNIIQEFTYSYKSRLLIGGMCLFLIFSVILYLLSKSLIQIAIIFLIVSVTVFYFIFTHLLHKIKNKGFLLFAENSLNIHLNSNDNIIVFEEINSIECYYYFSNNRFGFFHELQKIVFLNIKMKNHVNFSFPCKTKSADAKNGNVVVELKKIESEKLNIQFRNCLPPNTVTASADIQRLWLKAAQGDTDAKKRLSELSMNYPEGEINVPEGAGRKSEAFEFTTGQRTQIWNAAVRDEKSRQNQD